MALTFLPFCFPGMGQVHGVFQILSHATATENISLETGEDIAGVVAHRKALVTELGLDGLAEAKQVHGIHTWFEPEMASLSGMPPYEADGLSTSRPGLGLLIKTADCQPIFLAETSGRFVAALHVGWRGNRQNMPGSGVADFCARYGLHPEDVFAVRGPSLGPAAAQFSHFDEEWGSEFLPWFNPVARTMDLWSLTRYQLQKAGLRPEHIYSVDMCTFCLPKFFSYRRSPQCGRQASVVWIDKNS